MAAVEKAKVVWDEKLAAEVREHELSRKDDAERIARYDKRVAENTRQINSLESEVAALRTKQAALAESHAAVAPVTLAAVAPVTLAELLAQLNLGAHLPALQDEELDLELLRSMGSAVLASSMQELGMEAAEVARLSGALFPSSSVTDVS